ncbi:MAG: hypothetical protein ACYC0A_09590 [Lutibacter sp.]
MRIHINHDRYKFLYAKNTSIYLFIGFLCLNLFYFTNNFFKTFLNVGGNGDEYYQYNLYSIYSVTLEKIFYTPSQTYIFISSAIDYFINNPMFSTRVVSIISCLLLIIYFIRRLISDKSDSVEKIYKSTLFICAIFITNQMFIGTSDFLSVVLIIPAFLIVIESIEFKKMNLSFKQSVFVGVFFALAIATRPTTLVLILAFYITFFILAGIKPLFCKENLRAFITSIIVLFMINFLPIVEQHKIILDVKEVPAETGVNWFQRNYLMAKYWDSNKIPNTQWLSTQDVIDFKKANPDFVFPKNQVDLFIQEPGLYFRQLTRMFIKAMYSSYRFMYLLFPLLFLSFLNHKKFNIIGRVNSAFEKSLFQNKFVIIFHLISIVIFSFLAVKLFEFRWVISTLILYSFFALNYLSQFPLKVRFLVYNLSFISGITMYILFFIKTQ